MKAQEEPFAEMGPFITCVSAGLRRRHRVPYRRQSPSGDAAMFLRRVSLARI